uniref:Olfactory receptor n=1 Tax=Monodelphis domestica TaxID=13616 RepID=F6XDC3_MONDO
MDTSNWTTAQEFIFSVFPVDWGNAVTCFVPLLFIYAFILIGNLIIIMVVQLNVHLHTPMYFFISILSFLEIWYTTSTIPIMLSSLLSERRSISLNVCMVQLYFFHSTGISEMCLLVAMAFDRYLAICKPLHYPTIMTPRLCVQLTLICCVCGFITPLPEVVWISTLPFCGSNHLEHVFSFSTCASHLTVVSLFFSTVGLTYLRFSDTHSLIWDTAIALSFTVLCPFFNPIIYSLRNKEIKEAIKKYMSQSKIFSHKAR